MRSTNSYSKKQKRKCVVEKKDKYFVYLLTAFVFAVNLSLVFNNNVWCDEAATINLVRMKVPGLIDSVIRDVHPPLYYLMLKFGGHFVGHNLVYYKLMSIIPCILLIICVNQWIMKNVKKNATLACIVFTVLTALAPCAQGKNLEVRMYTWAAFWVCVCAILCWEINRDINNIVKKILLVLCSLAAMYTHYFALLTVAIILCLELIHIFRINRKLILKLLPSYVLIAGGYFPWVPFMLRQARENVGIWPIKIDITPAYVIDLFRYPFEGDYSAYFTNEYTALMWIVIVTVFVLNILKVMKKKDLPENEITKFGLVMVGVFLGMIMCGTAVSIIFHPIIFRRYLFPAIDILWLGVAILFSQLDTRKCEKVFLVALISVMSLSAYKNSFNREYVTGTDEILDFANANFKDKDILINDNDICMGWELKYYFPQNENYYLEDGVLFSNDGITLWSEKTDIDICSEDRDTWYFCISEFKLDADMLNEKGYSVDAAFTGNFDNAYVFTLYHITKK